MYFYRQITYETKKMDKNSQPQRNIKNRSNLIVSN